MPTTRHPSSSGSLVGTFSPSMKLMSTPYAPGVGFVRRHTPEHTAKYESRQIIQLENRRFGSGIGERVIHEFYGHGLICQISQLLYTAQKNSFEQ